MHIGYLYCWWDCRRQQHFSAVVGRAGRNEWWVSGTATYNGKPIVDGRVNFMPTKESTVPMGGAVIKNGQYRADAKGGVPVGTHTIRIEAYGGSPAPGQILKPGTLPQYLPRKFNVDSQNENYD